MSDWLDQQLDLLDWVAADVKQRNVEKIGRKGLTIESVLRCAILKQYRQLSYEDLVFCLVDSTSCQTFARITTGWAPKKAASVNEVARFFYATFFSADASCCRSRGGFSHTSLIGAQFRVALRACLRMPPALLCEQALRAERRLPGRYV